ncbi:protein NLP6-like isoform X1 [Bidens hawaiensis]|uniref:protein NLP6-like isoform X1 n=1 Tax=Bidens hawaiensis TaxID=980011 RepID=UPI00404B42BF
MPSHEISLEQSRLAFSGESKYLPKLHVFGNQHHQVNDLDLGADKVDRNYQEINDSEVNADKSDSTHDQKIHDKIITALKLLTFREQHVFVQFWSPRVVGKHHLLTTRDQPFGLGVNDERLYSYKRDSEYKPLVLDKDIREEEDSSPAARVFTRGLPEWTYDLSNYTSKQFPLQECAARCNLHGYLALPVLDSITGLCLGVIELLTYSVYKSYAYEVQQFYSALEKVDLRTQQAFDCPILNVSRVPNERRRNDLDKICSILKTMCDTHGLPLAQTWAVSPQASFVSHKTIIQKSCSSFNTKCVEKVCMSTTALPFHVKDLRVWPFLKAGRQNHLDSSCGFVGKALLSRGSCFCEDVTKLSEEEYPLVHNARMNRLTSCFTIFFHSVEANDDYVLEFFLPPEIKDSNQVLNLVQTLKQIIGPLDSGFELGDSSCIQVVGPPTEVGKSLSIDAHIVQISSITTTNNIKFETATSDSESIMVNIADKTEPSANVESKQIYVVDDTTQHNAVDARENSTMISYPNASMPKTSNSMTNAGEKTNLLKQGRKRKIDSLTMEAVEKHVEKTIDQAAKSLDGNRSTLKRFCRDNNMPSWPLPKHSKKTVPVTNLKLSQKLSPKQNLQQAPSKYFGLAFVGLLVVRVKRWKSKISMRNNALHNGDHLAVSESTEKPEYTISIIDPCSHAAEYGLVRASPKHTVTNISDLNMSDIKMVTVKTTFKNDMIKFQFPTSSSLLELEHEVERRIKLKSGEFRLKYKDEDEDLILLACDADLHNLLRVADNHSTIKLIIPED